VRRVNFMNTNGLSKKTLDIIDAMINNPEYQKAFIQLCCMKKKSDDFFRLHPECKVNDEYFSTLNSSFKIPDQSFLNNLQKCIDASQQATLSTDYQSFKNNIQSLADIPQGIKNYFEQPATTLKSKIEQLQTKINAITNTDEITKQISDEMKEESFSISSELHSFVLGVFNKVFSIDSTLSRFLQDFNSIATSYAKTTGIQFSSSQKLSKTAIYISIFSVLVSLILSFSSCYVAHKDSESTTQAINQVFSSDNDKGGHEIIFLILQPSARSSERSEHIKQSIQSRRKQRRHNSTIE